MDWILPNAEPHGICLQKLFLFLWLISPLLITQVASVRISLCASRLISEDQSYRPPEGASIKAVAKSRID